MKTAAIVLFLVAATLHADTLLLRDGRRVDGRLISVRDGIVEFEEGRFGPARLLRVERDQVLGIEFTPDDRNNSRAFGQPANPGVRPSGLRERQVMVAGNVPWTDSGVDVRAGQDIYFEASGEVTWGPNGRRHGPAGEPNSPINTNRPIPNRPAAALIGRVGENSRDYFYIGLERGPMRMRENGRLFLAVNDDVLQDNSGAFRVVIYY